MKTLLILALLTLSIPAHAQRVVDKKFIAFNAIELGAGLADTGMTQLCISEHTCHEANPLVPTSLKGQLLLTFAQVGMSTGISYYLKKHGFRGWWLVPTVGIVGHSYGAARASTYVTWRFTIP